MRTPGRLPQIKIEDGWRGWWLPQIKMVEGPGVEGPGAEDGWRGWAMLAGGVWIWPGQATGLCRTAGAMFIYIRRDFFCIPGNLPYLPGRADPIATKI